MFASEIKFGRPTHEQPVGAAGSQNAVFEDGVRAAVALPVGEGGLWKPGSDPTAIVSPVVVATLSVYGAAGEKRRSGRAAYDEDTSLARRWSGSDDPIVGPAVGEGRPAARWVPSPYVRALGPPQGGSQPKFPCPERHRSWRCCECRAMVYGPPLGQQEGNGPRGCGEYIAGARAGFVTESRTERCDPNSEVPGQVRPRMASQSKAEQSGLLRHILDSGNQANSLPGSRWPEISESYLGISKSYLGISKMAPRS